MFHNTREKFDFWGVLNVNRLRVAPEKLSTIGAENGGKLSVVFFGRREGLMYFCITRVAVILAGGHGLPTLVFNYLSY